MLQSFWITALPGVPLQPLPRFEGEVGEGGILGGKTWLIFKVVLYFEGSFVVQGKGEVWLCLTLPFLSLTQSYVAQAL